jgi:uncharacterized membrane protein
MDREAFFAVLDQLTLPQIEARLPLWDAEQLKFAEEYLDRNGVKYTQMEQDTRPNTESASAVTAKSYKMATIALIIAIGAMLAAIASGLIALEALQAR